MINTESEETLILCSLCKEITKVYGLWWSALRCTNCGEYVERKDWSVMSENDLEDRAVNWLAERGMFEALDESRTSIKVREKDGILWALIFYKDFGDIDCFHINSSNIHAEAWCDIKFNDSPFIKNNDHRTEKALGKITKEYKEYLKEWGVSI